MNITHKLLEAIRSKNWHEANVLFERSMQERMIARVDDIKKRVMMEDSKRCELCGGTSNVKMVDDTPLCAKCDPESDLDESKLPNGLEDDDEKHLKETEGKTLKGGLSPSVFGRPKPFPIKK